MPLVAALFSLRDVNEMKRPEKGKNIKVKKMRNATTQTATNTNTNNHRKVLTSTPIGLHEAKTAHVG